LLTTRFVQLGGGARELLLAVPAENLKIIPDQA